MTSGQLMGAEMGRLGIARGAEVVMQLNCQRRRYPWLDSLQAKNNSTD